MKTLFRFCWILVPILALAGCLNSPNGNGSSWKDRFRPFSGPTGADVVVFEVAVLEVSPVESVSS